MVILSCSTSFKWDVDLSINALNIDQVMYEKSMAKIWAKLPISEFDLKTSTFLTTLWSAFYLTKDYDVDLSEDEDNWITAKRYCIDTLSSVDGDDSFVFFYDADELNIAYDPFSSIEEGLVCRNGSIGQDLLLDREFVENYLIYLGV